MNTDIKPQTPAQGISVNSKWKDATSYHINCDCGSADHAVNMWIEIQDTDPDVQSVEVGFYVETWSPFWDKNLTRFKMIWDILTRGYHKQEHHLILDKQAALNFANTIINEVATLEKHHGNKKASRNK